MLAERELERDCQEFRYLQKTFSLEDTKGMAQAVKDDGFALIPGVLSRDEIAATRAALDRLRPFGLDGMSKTEHYKCVFNREPIWRDYLDRPGVIELAETLMGEQCHCIGESAWKSHPGHNGWGNHADKIFMTLPKSVFDDPEFELPVLICTAHYYLDDMTLDLAPTYVIPGSHKSGRSPRKGEEEWQGRKLEPVLCKAGDVLFFRSEVWHTGSENKTTDGIRYLLQVHYSHRDIAQKWSPFPWSFNPEILATSNERQLRLLGKHPEGAYG
jgi:hypothetical protein